MKNQSNKESVRGTGNSAALCKLSSVQKGYYADPFIQYFVQKKEKVEPIMNRGFYMRVHAMDRLISQFLNANSESSEGVQIIQLGGGKDTTFWRLRLSGENEVVNKLVWYEIDFPRTIQEKLRIISRVPKLQEPIVGWPNKVLKKTSKGAELHSPDYHLICGDLRKTEDLHNSLQEHGVNFEIPTLFISECVLVYVEPNSADKLLGYITETFKLPFFVMYEPTNPLDNFGKQMMKNLSKMGCPLLAIEQYNSIESQIKRFQKLGFNYVDVKNMKLLWDTLGKWEAENVDGQKERKRIIRLEWFDELEEWNMIMSHYFVLYAAKNDQISQEKFIKIFGL
eukprot:Anaeramoba_flamelloidesc40946_g1_i1.p1 GENE.c40946_g1_i1~~c40946_g1_i1.p1  ORF type:complete len:338 (+),score=64.16 c40946_g1_i1:100-1113(+)